MGARRGRYGLRNKTYSGTQKAEVNGGIYYEKLYGVRPAHAKHFWPCDEYKDTPSFSLNIHDVIGDAYVPKSDFFSYVTVKTPCDPYHVDTGSGTRFLGNSDLNKTFSCFAGKDWTILIASKGRGASCFEWTLGGASSAGGGEGTDTMDESHIYLKIQPYYFAINYNGHWQAQPWAYIHTKQRTASTVTRNIGQEYMLAFVKRGNMIEHWVDGVKQGENDLDKLLLAEGQTYGDMAVLARELIDNMTPLMRLRIGHSGTGLMNQELKTAHAEYSLYPHFIEGDTSAYIEKPASFGNDGLNIVNERTQYTGALISSWDRGNMPDTASFMNWHKTQWFAGNKRIDYPG